jgi:hypothetical protein
MMSQPQSETIGGSCEPDRGIPVHWCACPLTQTGQHSSSLSLHTHTTWGESLLCGSPIYVCCYLITSNPGKNQGTGAPAHVGHPVYLLLVSTWKCRLPTFSSLLHSHPHCSWYLSFINWLVVWNISHFSIQLGISSSQLKPPTRSSLIIMNHH